MGTLQWSSQGRSLRGENPSKKLRSWFNPGWRLPSDLKIFKMESGYAACRDLCWKKYERLVTCDVLMQVVQLAAHHPSLPLQFFLLQAGSSQRSNHVVVRPSGRWKCFWLGGAGVSGKIARLHCGNHARHG